MRDSIIEFINKHRKPVYKVKAGDIAVLDISGHCGARCVNSVGFLSRRHLRKLKSLIQQYEEWAYRTDSDTCEHCGLPSVLQWGRFMVKEVSDSDIKQALELNMGIDDLYRELYSI
ncbi:MAG: hypothetical protein QW733_07460 [Desulfurococcaceae archaeon]